MYTRRNEVTTLNDKVYNALVYVINRIKRECCGEKITGRSVREVGDEAVRTYLDSYSDTKHYNALYEKLLWLGNTAIMGVWKEYLRYSDDIGGMEYLCREIQLTESETKEFVDMYIEMKINENTPRKLPTLEERIALLERKVEHLENYPGIKFDDITHKLIKKISGAMVVGTNRRYKNLQELFIKENIRKTEKSSEDLVKILNAYIVRNSGDFIHFSNFGIKIGLVVK